MFTYRKLPLKTETRAYKVHWNGGDLPIGTVEHLERYVDGRWMLFGWATDADGKVHGTRREAAEHLLKFVQ